MDWIEEQTGESFVLPIIEFDIKKYTRFLSKVCKSSLANINTKLAAIQNFCNFLHSSYGLPIVKVQKKKDQAVQKVEVLEKKQLYKYRQYVYKNASLFHKVIVETLLNTGIRESELCCLESDDVVDSPKNAYIIIRNPMLHRIHLKRLFAALKSQMLLYNTVISAVKGL